MFRTYSFICENFLLAQGPVLVSVLNSMYRLGLVNTLVTHANIKVFGLTPLSGDRHGYMPPLLKTKTRFPDLVAPLLTQALKYSEAWRHTLTLLLLLCLALFLCTSLGLVRFKRFTQPSQMIYCPGLNHKKSSTARNVCRGSSRGDGGGSDAR